MIVLDFQLDKDIIQCLQDKQYIALLKHISVERIRDELAKCFQHDALKTIQQLVIYHELAKFLFSPNIGMMTLKPHIQK